MRPFRYRTTPFNHQIDTVLKVREMGHCAILNDMGTGKGKCVVDIVDDAQDRSDRPLRILIVAPNVMVDSWADEFSIHSRNFKDTTIVRHAKRDKRADLARNGSGVFIINYEGVRTLRCKPGADRVDGKTNLAYMDWDYVIADEVTALNSRSSAQSRAMRDFVKQCPGATRIGLTGTPITDQPLNVFSVFLFIDPSVFGENFFWFRNRYAITRNEQIYIKGIARQIVHVDGYQNTEELWQKVMSKSVRWRKEDCGLDLPRKVFSMVPVEWPKKARKIYDAMAQERITAIGGKVVAAANVISSLSKLRQICQGWMYTDTDGGYDRKYELIDGKPAKVDVVTSLLSMSPDPFIIFCDFNADVEILKTHLTDFVVISGLESDEERAEAKRRFQSGNVKVCICKTSVTKFGVTLTAAPNAIYYSNDWGLEQRLQSLERIHRIGQESDVVSYFDICMKDSIDVAIRMLHQSKAKMVQSVTGEQISMVLNGEVPSGWT